MKIVPNLVRYRNREKSRCGTSVRIVQSYYGSAEGKRCEMERDELESMLLKLTITELKEVKETITKLAAQSGAYSNE